MHHPRYALLSGRHALAFCADVDGLYGEPVPRPRAVHEIRGCEPRGELARAVTEAVVEGTAPLGTLHVRTHDGLVWRFDDCRVLGARGDVVTVESKAGPRRWHGRPPGDTGHAEVAGDPGDAGDTRDARDFRSTRGAKESRDGGGAGDERGAWESRDAEDTRGTWESWDARDARDARESWDAHESWGARESGDAREPWSSWAARQPGGAGGLGGSGDPGGIRATEDPAVPCGNLVPVTPSPPETRTHTEVTFLGCSPRGGLRDALAAGAEEYEAVRYQVLGHVGDSRHEAEAGRVTGWDTSARGRGLIDLTVAFPRAGLVPHQTREVWELWHRDRPAEPGTWRRFTGAARAEWLRQAGRSRYGVPEIVPGSTYHLDGTDTTDEDALNCALGEAVHGPGLALGVVGTPRALGELLADTTLVWHRSDVARACLGVQPWSGPRPATFQEYTDGLRAAGVRLVLE
ncbi:hypothetical protein [Streptomyces sp. NPDC059247]|uniref:hypothetical protein n=1 Tax=Streptomyces sp. NPDC059247 TaxID=3346790 RepID=UPI0036A40FED